MGKHSKEKGRYTKHGKEKNTSINAKNIIEIIIIVILISSTIYTYQNWEKIKNVISSWNFGKNNNIQIINDTTIENECLVIKSLTEYNKIIEYKFANNTLEQVFIYEQFKDKEKFEYKKQNYENQKNIIIKNIDEKKLSIAIEKKDFGTDKDLSYDKIYDKYLVQIIGAYEIK